MREGGEVPIDAGVRGLFWEPMGHIGVEALGNTSGPHLVEEGFEMRTRG
jgi:hypothetical protein